MSPQTVTFPCPFCGRRMGVPAELLGKQVRCPHCKQVVLAPLNVAPSGIVPALNLPPPPPSMVGPNAQTQAISAPNAPPPPAPEPDLPTFAIQRREGADSILGGPGESEDEVFAQPGGGRLPAVPPLDLSGPTAPRPTVSDDNPFEIASTAPTAAVGATGPRANTPAATSELPNPFLELEPVTLPAAFQPAAPPGGRPAGPPPAPFQPPQSPRPAFPTPAAFPSAPLPAPAPAANPFAGIDDPTMRPHAGPVPLPVPVPVPGPESTTESIDDQPRKRRRSRREEEEAPPAKAAEEKPRSSRTRAAAAPSAGVGNVLLFIAIGYGVLVTGLAAWALFLKGPTLPPEHPLSTIPDNFGEFDPAQSQKRKTSQSGYRFNVDGDLPPAQRAALGSPITVGKMEITPLRVERRPLVIEREPVSGAKMPPEQTRGEALVLTLSIKNTSDLTFHPMDPAFTRKANEGKKDFPITRVVVDKKKFYAGGYIEWPIDPNRLKRMYETQQVNDTTPLGPGQTREYVVFTDARNTQILRDAKEAKESLQWRVEVRRAPTEIGGKELPVTAIVGVDFKWADVQTPNLKVGG